MWLGKKLAYRLKHFSSKSRKTTYPFRRRRTGLKSQKPKRYGNKIKVFAHGRNLFRGWAFSHGRCNTPPSACSFAHPPQ
jgi:hypothetical protein